MKTLLTILLLGATASAFGQAASVKMLRDTNAVLETKIAQRAGTNAPTLHGSTTVISTNAGDGDLTAASHHFQLGNTDWFDFVLFTNRDSSPSVTRFLFYDAKSTRNAAYYDLLGGAWSFGRPVTNGSTVVHLGPVEFNNTNSINIDHTNGPAELGFQSLGETFYHVQLYRPNQGAVSARLAFRAENALQTPLVINDDQSGNSWVEMDGSTTNTGAFTSKGQVIFPAPGSNVATVVNHVGQLSNGRLVQVAIPTGSGGSGDFKADGSVAMTGTFNGGGNPITNVSRFVGAAPSPATNALISIPGTNGPAFTIQASLVGSNITWLAPTNGFEGMTNPVVAVTNIACGTSGCTGRLYFVERASLGSGGSQTPWTQTIDGDGNDLTAVGDLDADFGDFGSVHSDGDIDGGGGITAAGAVTAPTGIFNGGGTNNLGPTTFTGAVYARTNTAPFDSITNPIASGLFWTNTTLRRVALKVVWVLNDSAITGFPSLCMTNVSSGEFYNPTNSFVLAGVTSGRAEFHLSPGDYFIATNKSSGSATATVEASFGVKE